MALLAVERVSFGYGAGFQLRDIDLEVETGSFLALLGPNGSGKSTLIKLISGLEKPSAGRILLDGRPLQEYRLRERATKMAVIPSENHFEFPFRAREVAAMGRFPYLGRLQAMSDQDWETVDEALDMTQARQFAARPISELSSGERQRVLIARALAQDPKLLILDEPNAHLDIKHQISIFRLLSRLNRENGMTIVVVLHDLTMASVFCQTVAVMDRGRLVKQGAPSEVITTQNIRDIFGADVIVRQLGEGAAISYSAEPASLNPEDPRPQ